MKKIIRITKIELGTLFYSPIAWLLLIVFFVQCAMGYTDSLKGWITLQELGGNYLEQLVFLTQNILASPNGLTSQVAHNLYLYLPLLTMGLISREISSGTIKLLYSSPVTVRDIVLGKFFAISVYSLLLTITYGVLLLLGVFHLQGADTGLMLSIMLGIFMLLCAYGAIGLFVSCLTSYQVVAAISTFVLFAFLNYIGTVWQDIDFVRDITYSLSLTGRINNMGGGLITTKDLCYFTVVIGMFIGLSILKLQATRSTDTAVVKAFKYSVVVLAALFIGFITSRPTFIGYFDATATKTRTLTKTSREILKDMGDSTLEVTSYINLLDNSFVWYGLPASRNTDLERWLPYIRFKPGIDLKYVYYYDSIPDYNFYKQYPNKTLEEIAENSAKSFRTDLDLFKKPEIIRKMIDLRPEANQYVMHLKYKEKSTFLRLFYDPMIFPTERETGAALKRLIVKLPTIAFLEGELERRPDKTGDKDYYRMTSEKTFRYAMINQGFDFISVSLKEAEIPADASALVIADPRAPFEPAVLEKIQRYIDEGGNLLIAGEPGKQAVLNPLLEKLGISMMEGRVVQNSEDFSPDLSLNFLTGDAAALSKTMGKVFKDSIPISMPGVSGLYYDSTGPFTIRPLLMTDERNAWRKTGALHEDSTQVHFSVADGDEKGKFPTMLALTRTMNNGKEQHIIVSGDADFLSTAELGRYLPRTANFYLNTDLFGWLSNGEFPVDVSRPEATDKVIRLEGSDIPMLKAVLIWIIPALIGIGGIILLVRRRKQ